MLAASGFLIKHYPFELSIKIEDNRLKIKQPKSQQPESQQTEPRQIKRTSDYQQYECNLKNVAKIKTICFSQVT